MSQLDEVCMRGNWKTTDGERPENWTWQNPVLGTFSIWFLVYKTRGYWRWESWLVGTLVQQLLYILLYTHYVVCAMHPYHIHVMERPGVIMMQALSGRAVPLPFTSHRTNFEILLVSLDTNRLLKHPSTLPYDDRTKSQNQNTGRLCLLPQLPYTMVGELSLNSNSFNVFPCSYILLRLERMLHYMMLNVWM